MWIFPVVIGTGKRCFGDGTIPAGLKLVDSRATKSGVTVNTYERAGDIGPGSFAIDEPTEAEIERRKRLAEEDSDDEGSRDDHDVGRRLRGRADDGPGKGLGEGGERLHYWVFGGPWTYAEEPRGEATGEDAAFLQEGMGRAGAVVSGRFTYEAARHWGDENPFGVPMFIVTHRPEEEPDTGEFTFVSGVEDAVGGRSRPPATGTSA